MKNTIKNLASAFVGESQARNRYTLYAKKAKEDELVQISEIFLLTADQEKEHAKWLFRLINQLKESSKDDYSEIKLEAPVPTILGSTEENLVSAIEGENYEFTEMYPRFIQQAKAENNSAAQRTFDWANKVEKIHHGLYQKALETLEAGQQLKDEPYFVCQACGYTVDGEAPDRCPVCGAPLKMFKRVD